MTPQASRILSYLRTEPVARSNSHIAQNLGIPTPSVRRSTAQLETAGMVTGRYLGSQDPNLYFSPGLNPGAVPPATGTTLEGAEV